MLAMTGNGHGLLRLLDECCVLVELLALDLIVVVIELIHVQAPRGGLFQDIVHLVDDLLLEHRLQHDGSRTALIELLHALERTGQSRAARNDRVLEVQTHVLCGNINHFQLSFSCAISDVPRSSSLKWMNEGPVWMRKTRENDPIRDRHGHETPFLFSRI